MDKHILVFCSREICYHSGNFFANQLASAFEELGVQTELCEFSKDDDIDAQLKPYIGQEYRAIVDFNSMLPRMALEDDSYYLDHLSGPFFDYILDHPLFHYSGLTSKAKNLHVLVLDEAHKRYVERYYPQVRSVHMLPLGATEAMYQGEKQHTDRILFLGTYDTTEYVMDIVKAAPKPLRTVMEALIERRIAEPLLPMEEAFSDYLQAHGMEISAEEFALYMNAMYAVDAYVRDYFREKTLECLLSHHIPVVVAGERWENFRTPHREFFNVEKSITFALSFEKIAKEAVLLNAFPVFNRGMHDRIPAGMANHTVVLTDRNPYLEKCFTNEKQLCFYDLNDPESLVGKAETLLFDARLRDEIQQNAYEEFQKNHTWKKRAEQILTWADRMEIR